MKKILVVALTLVQWIGCKKSEDSPVAPTSKMILAMNFSGLQPLAGGFHYEGWAMVNNQPLPTGKFNIDAQNSLTTLSGQVITNGEFNVGFDIGSASAIIITIEPAGDNDIIPAATKYLGGNVSNGAATLTIAHAAALGTDFTSAAGKYILATPTDTVSSNERSGVWFLQLPGATAGLSVPNLPAGWKYEGWAVANQPLTTGKFSSSNSSDQAAPYSGPNPGPPFPGEDFLLNAPGGLTFPLDLAGKTIVLSVEPDPDDSPNPFTLKPLAHQVPANAQDHVTFTMLNQATSTSPTGTANIR
ncbi:MAG: hypothetical protein HYY49_14460 [Ignavibacteriales bacterium]|nr:hypothetical protein [Ignavibacteriales bacterium]